MPERVYVLVNASKLRGQGLGRVEGLETPIRATNYSSQPLTDCSRPSVLKAQTSSSKSSRHNDQLVTGSVMASFF